jgi:hypothetical protein
MKSYIRLCIFLSAILVFAIFIRNQDPYFNPSLAINERDFLEEDDDWFDD